MTVFLLIDVRHEPQNNDLEFMKWLAVSQIPFTIVFTKADKLKATQTDKNLSVYKKNLLREWEALPEMIITSATKSKGREELLSFIGSTNKLYTT
jgi:GTP-binding protein